MTSPLREQRLSRVQEALLTVGYESSAIVSEYDFAVPGHQTSLGKVDLAAFSDPIRHDLHTSCIAAEYVSEGTDIQTTLSKLAYLAPPVALMLGSDGVDIWPVAPKPSQQPIEHVRYDALTQYFAGNARHLSPDAIASAKTKGYQPGFLDLDQTLFQFAYQTTREILVRSFESAVSAARQSMASPKVSYDPDLTKATLQILAGAILEDKQLLGRERSSTVRGLIRRSANRYGQYFDTRSIDKLGRDAAQVTFDTLRRNVTFRSFTNEMLGYFYENALVDDELRRELGIYYTPRSIAKRMLSRLPVEDIEPSKRVVFDGSSGSGNLLLAAFERLVDLVPVGWSREQRHTYLVERLHGVDVDPFAVQVAGLSLFFMDLPAGDAWDIAEADFTSSASPNVALQPTILVGNPPFKESRSFEGARHQQATLFLNKYLDILEPGGLLGVVLPETFLENSSCRDARRRLLRECEVLDICHLPEGIFPMSQVATVTVLAKKLPAMRPHLSVPVRIEKISGLRQERESFLNGDRPRFSYIVPSTRKWVDDQNARVSSSPLDRRVWDEISVHRKLENVASVRNGVIPGAKQRETHIDHVMHGPDWRPWLGGTRSLEPYSLKRDQREYVKYPGDLQWPRLDLETVFLVPGKKVLVNSGRAPNNPWRLYAAIDGFGYVPSQSFYCVIPKEDAVSLEELVAVLNSSVANAWVDGLNRKRWIERDILHAMPFPTFTEGTRETIIARVRAVMALKLNGLTGSSRRYTQNDTIREMVRSIDDLVCEAFGIEENGRKMLSKYFAGYRRPGVEWSGYRPQIVRDATDPDGRRWPMTGQVLLVDAETDEMTIWMRGYNEDQPFTASIPESMPGWALRQDATFQADTPWHSRDAQLPEMDDLTNFRPLDFSYASTAELVDLLTRPENLDALYGV